MLDLFYINIHPYEFEQTISNILDILNKKLKIDHHIINVINREIIKYKVQKNKIINQKEISKELYENIKLFFST